MENKIFKKNFDDWTKIKKITENKGRPLILLGEIFWCRFGINIGVEYDGKDNESIRPVLIIKKYTDKAVFVLPLTTQIHKGDWYFGLKIKDKEMQLVLNQGRTIDTKRLLNKIERISEDKLKNILDKFTELFYK